MALFQQSIINKYLEMQAQETLDAKWEIYKNHFLNTEIQSKIRNFTEIQYQGGFLTDLFVNILGYTRPPMPNHNLTTELKNINDAKRVDGAILLAGEVHGVIELKDTKTTDLKKVEPQAFGYKHNHPNCIYVITSNFEKLRFYIDNAVEHLEFNLFALTKEEFALLYLCLSYQSISQNLPKKIKEESIGEENEITEKLYKVYSNFKKELYENILKLNAVEPELLLRKTQKLLDRFLFLCFAEDKLLLPANSVKSVLDKWRKPHWLDDRTPLYDIFKKFFGYIDTGFKRNGDEIFNYNGGLFKPDEILDNLLIDNDLLYENMAKLADYNFASEVDVNILGRIFENSLNTTSRKKEGVFYTPRYITKYIVENTVGKLCQEQKEKLEFREEEFAITPPQTKNKKEKELFEKEKKRLLEKINTYREWLLQLTILDPACGSGAFLNEALQFLIEEHKYIDKLQAKLLGDSLSLENITNEILENNIFGVDLNEESVEIAKLSLWLRTAQRGRQLSSLTDNIKCGNSLIDDAQVAGNKAFNWQANFLKIFEKGGFDVVIGNPPYVRQEALTTTDKEYYSRKYAVGNGTADLYVYFYEKAFQVLKENGLLGFITPNKFYKTQYGKELRQYLMNYKIIDLIDFFELKVFEDASTDAQILTAQKTNEKTPFYYSPLKNLESFTTDFHSIVINPDNLNVNSWVFANNMESGILAKIKQNAITIAEYTKNGIEYGIKTGLNEAFIIDENTKNKILAEDAKSKALIKPYINPTDIHRYHLDKSNAYYFINTRYDLDISKYKGVFNWLTNFDKKLQARQDKGKHHFNLRACKYYDKLEQPKIIYIYTAVNHHFYYDEEGYYINNSCYLISNADKFLSVWLNSKVFSFYKKLHFVAYGDSSEKGRAKLDYNKFINTPIPIISEEQKQPFIEKADKMLLLNKNLQTLSQKVQRNIMREFSLNDLPKKLESWYSLSYKDFLAELAKKKVQLTLAQKGEWEEYFEKESAKVKEIAQQISETDKEIDQMVYELYGLTPEEIAIVEHQ